MNKLIMKIGSFDTDDYEIHNLRIEEKEDHINVLQFGGQRIEDTFNLPLTDQTKNYINDLIKSSKNIIKVSRTDALKRLVSPPNEVTRAIENTDVIECVVNIK